GSKTEVLNIFTPEIKGAHVILQGTTEEIVQNLIRRLKKDKIL
ncbi:hypothetical protein LCGC14_1137670, partial [marine sediment metagenome]